MEPLTLALIGVPSGLVLVGFLALVYSGLFYPIRIGVGACSLPSVRFAYKFHRGPYEQVGHLFHDACRLAPKSDYMGIYYDDPYKVKASELRSAIGVVLYPDDASSADVQRTMEESGYRTVLLPHAGRVVHINFPFRTRLTIYIAIHRVWAAITAYCNKHGLSAEPWMEVYTKHYIKYFGLLEAHDEFVMAECRQ